MNLNQVTVPCSDIEKSIEFYSKLGLKLIVHSAKHYARFICPDGESTFSLMKEKGLYKNSSIKIYFEVNELDGKVEELLVKKIQFEELPENKPWLWREALLKDPDGNKLVLFSAGENRINPPWRLKKSN